MKSSDSSKGTGGCSRRTFLQSGASLAVTAFLPFSGQAQPASWQAAAQADLSELAFASAREAARAVRQRTVSSLELTDFMLGRIEKYNSTINAIVASRFERARQRAREADEAMGRGEIWGPLHGVPITVKESYDVAGLPSTWGNPQFAENIPELDATVVTRLHRAGAVLLGKTNVPFMLADWQAFNDLYGVTRNPWDLERSPGGSTGGGAAALAAGLTYLSMGGDLGGSIRVPAHFCGVFGHKPSRGLVPAKGHQLPLPPVVLPDLDVLGPLARTAADLKLALEIVGGPDEQNAVAYHWKLPSARGARLADYRIGYVLDHPQVPVASDMKAVLGQFIETLRRAGARLEEGWPEGADPVKIRDAYLYLLEQYIPWDINEDGRLGREASHADVQKATNDQLEATAIWRDYFRTRDAFLLPPFFTTAFAHDHSGTPITERVISTPDGPRRLKDVFLWTAPANLLGLPATVAPIGLTADGLPVGVQILGPFLEDATPIAVAGHITDVTGGVRPPGGYQD